MAGITVVTGTNRGIGLELVRQLVARGDHVVAACRAPSPELTATGAELASGVDVTTEAGVQALVAAVGDREVGLLVCNAGVLTRETIDDLDLDRIRWQLEVNALGPLRVTAALRPRFASGSKVGIVTSRMGSIADNTSGSMYGYRMSKAAVNMAGRSLSHDLAQDGVMVVLLHPGYVRTAMTGHNGFIDPDASAAGLIARIDELSPDTTGSFVHAEGQELPW